jgi:flagellar biosynthesis protein FliR
VRSRYSPPMTFVIPDLAVAFMLTFARVGTLVMLMPGIGEQMIAPRARLGFALLLSLVLFPFTRTLLPAAGTPAALIGMLIGEIAIGFVLGLATRMVVAALQTAGTIVAQQLGLAFAMTVDPAMGGQQAAVGNLLTLLGLTLIFTTDLHHLAIAAIRDSYAFLPPAGVPATGDAAALAIRAVGRSFALAVQISAPFIAFAILFNLGLGVLSRLMPQLQVFFLGLPATILIGMLVLLAVIGVMMSVFVTDLGAFLRDLGGR